MYDKNNVFAKILRGEIPVNGKVYENEYALAFRDAAPVYENHILVLPKFECENILDFVTHANYEQQAGFWSAVKEAAEKAGISGSYKAVANTGKPYQSVFHFHLHLVSGKKVKNPDNSAAV
jgi:histidine triad (HIT) family protein